MNNLSPTTEHIETDERCTECACAPTPNTENEPERALRAGILDAINRLIRRHNTELTQLRIASPENAVALSLRIGIQEIGGAAHYSVSLRIHRDAIQDECSGSVEFNQLLLGIDEHANTPGPEPQPDELDEPEC